VKVVALDYGRARTGVAVSDPTGTVARPVGVVERVGTEEGLAELRRVIGEEQAERVVVGLPLTLRGSRGEQARETEHFVETLRGVLDVPVELYDERFTTDLAERHPRRLNAGARQRARIAGARAQGERHGGEAPEDARAAAHLLSDYLAWSSRRA
jgi:putative Holliday junction resolvase